MRGSVNYQINEIFKCSGIFRPGESKHADKDAARVALGAEGRTGTSQAIASKTTIHSYETARAYKTTWHEIGHYARSMGLKSLTHLEPRHIQGYLEKRIADGVSKGTWRKEAAHAAKLGNALTAMREGKTVDFRPAINDLRELAYQTLSNPDGQRGFESPRTVLDEVRGADNQLRAAVQLEGGARMHEVLRLDPGQLRGDGRIWLTNTKGGKPREIRVSAQTYQRLADRLASGPMVAKASAYRSEIGRAADRAGEFVRGTHDFRYNYAQGRYMDLTRAGTVAEVAHQIISREMGHERADITLHYLV